MENQKLKSRLIIKNLPIVLCLGAIVIALSLLGMQIRKSATIIINQQAIPVYFWGFKVKDALRVSGVDVHEGDIVQPEVNQAINDRQIISITPASWFIVLADGEVHTFWSAESIPQEILGQLDLYINPGDELTSAGNPIQVDVPLPYLPVHVLQIKRATHIYLSDGNGTISITSTARTLGSGLIDAGLLIFQSDQLTPEFETSIDGDEIHATVERSRSGTIHYQGNTIPYRVIANTVGEALVKIGLPLQGLNYSMPSEEDPLPENGEIRIVDVEEEFIIEQKLLQFGLEYQALPNLPLDTQQVIQVGEYGLSAQRIRIIKEDGVETFRETEDEWIAKKPKSRIIGYGTRIDIQTAITPEGPIQYYRTVDAYATSYSPCRIGVTGQCSNRTASGEVLKKGVIGVIRSWYNAMKGSQVYITGYGFATIEDIGAGFSDRYWVDLGFSDDDWVSWSSYVTVYFLAPPPENLLYILE